MRRLAHVLVLISLGPALHLGCGAAGGPAGSGAPLVPFERQAPLDSPRVDAGDLEAGLPKPIPHALPEEVRGHYSYGFEINHLVPCGLDEVWCVDAPDPLEFLARHRQIVDRECEPVYVRLFGTKGPPGRYGHLGMCDRVFRVRKIYEMRPPAPDDCD